MAYRALSSRGRRNTTRERWRMNQQLEFPGVNIEEEQNYISFWFLVLVHCQSEGIEDWFSCRSEFIED